MQKTFIFLTFIMAAFAGCKKDSDKFTLHISVQSSFNKDAARIFVDGIEKMNKQLQTNYAIGFCPDGQTATTEKKGLHEIKIVINNAVTKVETFLLENNLFVGINFDKQANKISIVYAHQPFSYD